MIDFMYTESILGEKDIERLGSNVSPNDKIRWARGRRERLVTLATRTAIEGATDLGGQLPLGAVVASQDNVLAFRDPAAGFATERDLSHVEFLAYMEAVRTSVTGMVSGETPISMATNIEPCADCLDFVAESGIQEVIYCLDYAELVNRGFANAQSETLTQRVQRNGLPFNVVRNRSPLLVAQNRLLLDHTIIDTAVCHPVIGDVAALQADLAALAATR